MNVNEKFSEDLVFECLIPAVEKIMPIIPAKEVTYNWIETAREHFKIKRKESENKHGIGIHVARCPGIIDLHRTGWVLRTWQDIIIKTNGDLDTFTWATPIDQKELCFEAGETVQWHCPEDFSIFQKNFPPNTNRNILKIVTPWRIFIPKGFNLLELPIPYPDEDRFTVLPGMLKQGIASCNVQLLWHVPNGETLIPAGTPLAQYILVAEDQPKTIIRAAESHLIHQEFDLSINHKFYRNYEK